MIQSKILHSSQPTHQVKTTGKQHSSTTNNTVSSSKKQNRAQQNSINSDNQPNLSHYLSAPQLYIFPSQASDQKNEHEIHSSFHSSTAQADQSCDVPSMLVAGVSTSSSLKTDRNSQPLKTSKSQNNAAVVTTFPLITKSASGFKSMLFLTPPKIGTKISSSIKETKAALHLSSTCSQQSNTQSSFINQEQAPNHGKDCQAFSLDENPSSQENSIQYDHNISLLSESGYGGGGEQRKQQETGDQSMSEWNNKFNSLLESPTISNKYLGYQPDHQSFSRNCISIQQNRLAPKIDVQLCDHPLQSHQQQHQQQLTNDRRGSANSNGLLASGFNSQPKSNRTLTFNSSAPLLSKLQNYYQPQQQGKVQEGCTQFSSAISRKNGFDMSRLREQPPPPPPPSNSSNMDYKKGGGMDMFNHNSTSNLLQMASNMFQQQNNNKFFNGNNPFDNSNNCERKMRSQYKGSFNFPDGGWVCSICQNYNFYGRAKCNRCGKIKSKLDVNGKPKHLIKKEHSFFNPNQYFVPSPSNGNNNTTCSSSNNPQMGQYGFRSQFISSPTNSNNNNNINNNNNNNLFQDQQMLLMQQQQQQDEISRQQQFNIPPPPTFPIYNQNNNNIQQQPIQLSIQQQQLQQQRLYKKPLTERIGDWVCLNCRNLNFSFRVICNRCNLSREMYGQYVNRELYGQYVNREAQLMLPSINSPTSSSSSSHNIPMGISAPQHSHYFNGGNNLSPNNQLLSLPSFNANIQSPAFNPFNTGKENQQTNLIDKSKNDNEEEEIQPEVIESSKGNNEQEVQ